MLSQVKDVRDHKLENRQESFFLSETLKYLYLLFDEHNPIHAAPSSAPTPPGAPREQVAGTVIPLGVGARTCVVEVAGAYVFNTEAHPIDAGALACCSALALADDSELRAHASVLNSLAVQLTGLPVLLPQPPATSTPPASEAAGSADADDESGFGSVPAGSPTLREGRDVELMLDDVNRVINVLEESALPGDDVSGATFDLLAEYMDLAMRDEDESEGGLQLRRFSRRLQSSLFSDLAEKRTRERSELRKRHAYQVAAYGEAFVESKLAAQVESSSDQSTSNATWPAPSLLAQLCDECLVHRHTATAELLAHASRGESIDIAFNNLVRGVELCSDEQGGSENATSASGSSGVPDASRTCASLRRKPSPLLCPMRSFAASKLAFSGQVFSPETLS